MSSEKQNASKQTPQPDWKLEFEKQWKVVSDKANDFYNDHKNLFSLSKVSAILGGSLGLAWLISGIYIVDEGNRGVVTRFGAYVDTTLKMSASSTSNNNVSSKWVIATPVVSANLL